MIYAQDYIDEAVLDDLQEINEWSKEDINCTESGRLNEETTQALLNGSVIDKSVFVAT